MNISSTVERRGAIRHTPARFSGPVEGVALAVGDVAVDTHRHLSGQAFAAAKARSSLGTSGPVGV